MNKDNNEIISRAESLLEFFQEIYSSSPSEKTGIAIGYIEEGLRLLKEINT